MLNKMQKNLNRILKWKGKVKYDFRKYAFPDDELAYLFDEWVEYYNLKYAIVKTLKPKSILEIGVRYGYSAITFLKAAPNASYLGIDNDSNTFGGSNGAISWAQKITQNYNAKFLLANTQEMRALPGEYYDLIHVDGQQDGDGTFHDLEMALEKARYILVDGYFWSTENMLSATYFLKKYSKFIEYAITLPGYAGEYIIKTKEIARNLFIKYRTKNYSLLKEAYDTNYFMTDCGGYTSFFKTSGKVLDERLGAIFSLINPKVGEHILDIGCGRGELAFALSQAGSSVVGIDYSKDAIKIAHKTYSEYMGEKLVYINGDIIEYSIIDKFDKIIVSDVVEHIEQDSLEKLFIKIPELLKNTGFLFIHTAPNKLNYLYSYPRKRKVVASAGSYLPRNPRTFFEDLMHINEQTPAKLNRALKKHFKYTMTWVGNISNINEGLCKKFSVKDIYKASSIFSIASNSKINKDSIIDNMQDGIDAKEIKVMLYSNIKELRKTCSEIFYIPIIIHNLGNNIFRSLLPHPINISYHFIDEYDNLVVFDGLRTSINNPISAGEKKEFQIKIKTPEKPGRYVLKVSLVQEGRFWLDDVSIIIPLNISVIAS